MPLQFPSPSNKWNFDLVGLLTIIGEASISEVLQELTATRTTFIPRFLPAPHALIRPGRVKVLPFNAGAKVFGLYSGNLKDHVPYFADIIHGIDSLEPYSVRTVRLKWSKKSLDVERHADASRPENMDFKPEVRRLAPLKLLNVSSALLALGLMAWAIVRDDGPAVVAILLVCIASSSWSAASFWTVETVARPANRRTPPGNVVVKTTNNAFIHVECDDFTARVLYFAGLKCHYLLSGWAYRVFATLGSLCLIFGVIVITNCTWDLQVALGASFALVNILYLLAATSKSVSRRLHWDISGIEEELLSSKQYKNFTAALWDMIVSTGSVRWIEALDILAKNEGWKAWVVEAEAEMIRMRNDGSAEIKWDPIEAVSRLMQKVVDETCSPSDPQEEF